MIALQTFHSGPEPCQYLPDEQASMEHILVVQLSAVEYEAKMNAGWRKFGPVLFRPVCESCHACQPLRIPVAEFTPSRSQRRALAKNEALVIRRAKPSVDSQRLALYNRYHARREAVRGWAESDKSVEEYTFSFLRNPVPAVELSVWEGERLLAIVLVDVTPNAVSGVYHYYEPAEESRSLGTFVMLQTIALARELGKPWAYFGYWVAACPSLAYKTNFRPCELLAEGKDWESFNP